MAAGGPDAPNWRHSSFCNGGTCVEIAVQGDLVAVRVSGSPDGHVLTFPASSWQRFVADIESGDLV